MTALSTTCEIDISRDSKRAFQNVDTTYGEIVADVTGDSGAVCKTGKYDSKSIGSLALQYKETDWEFLIRMASRAGTGVVADYTSETPALKFVEEDGTLEITDEKDKLLSVSKYLVGGKEKVSYFFALGKGYEKGNEKKRECFIGTKCSYDGEDISAGNLLCKSLEVSVVEGAVIYTVELSEDLSEVKMFNDKISGISLKSTVIKNDGSEDSLTKIKVKIEEYEDEDSKSPILFGYSTLYSADKAGEHGGWHFMPEEGDTVMLYFPNNDEENAYCTCSLRKGEDWPNDVTH